MPAERRRAALDSKFLSPDEAERASRPPTTQDAPLFMSMPCESSRTGSDSEESSCISVSQLKGKAPGYMGSINEQKVFEEKAMNSPLSDHDNLIVDRFLY